MNKRYQTLIDDLLALDWPFCEAVVESVQIKKKTVKVSLTIEGDANVHALADAAGETVLVVVGYSLGKPGAGDSQAELFVPGQADDGENPQAAPAPAFNPKTDMPPDDDLTDYGKPIADEEDEDGIFNETPDKPPWS